MEPYETAWNENNDFFSLRHTKVVIYEVKIIIDISIWNTKKTVTRVYFVSWWMLGPSKFQ